MMDPITIVGSGLAGYTLARELRKLNQELPLRIISADDAGFYSKPMLSNALSQGRTPAALVTADAAHMAAQLKAEVWARRRVTAIDRPARRLTLENGEVAHYRALVLALGADPLGAVLTGDASAAVMCVNDLDDYERFRTAIAGKKRVAIIGGGLIGCEFANDLAAGGYDVEVIDRNAIPLGHLAPQALGAALRAALQNLGVAWHAGRGVSAARQVPQGVALTLDDGTVVTADAVLAATGLRPRTGLAAAAGLAVNHGISVDSTLRTGDPHIYALGDCAEVAGQVLPFVMPIMHGARALAQTLAGTPAPVNYPAMPVVVKTPAYPVVVLPPPRGVEGAWTVQTDGTAVRALYHGTNGALLGYALGGAATAEKNALTKQLP